MLSTLEHAFNEVCLDLKITPTEADGRLRTLIAQKLMDFAAIGITDLEELRARYELVVIPTIAVSMQSAAKYLPTEQLRTRCARRISA
jgi:hypothetical protein